MQNLVIVVCAVLLFSSSLLANPTQIESQNDERSLDYGYSKRKQLASLLGSKLGRRKRNSLDENFKRVVTDNYQLDSIMDAIQDTPWAIVAINEGKRHIVNFTPRLGRGSGEDLSSGSGSATTGDRWIQDPELSGDLMSQRSPPFAPRLGRRLVPFSPRLGRESDGLKL